VDDQISQELESLYTACLEWILNRPSSGTKALMIDDYDKISFEPALQILLGLVAHSNNFLR